MATKTWLDTSNDMEEYAARHGAKKDPTSGRWFVLGNPPPELFNLAIDNKSEKGSRPGGMRSLGEALVDEPKPKESESAPPPAKSQYVPPADALKHRVEAVVQLAAQTIGTRDGVLGWLNTPKRSLQNMTPIEAMKTMEGCAAVEALLKDLYS